MTRKDKIELLKNIYQGKKPIGEKSISIFENVEGQPDLIIENRKKIIKKNELDGYLKSKRNPFLINWADMNTNKIQL